MRIIRKAVCLLLTVMLCGTPMSTQAYASTTVFDGGSGTATDPYLISTAIQLNEVRNYRSNYFKLTQSIRFTAADFAQGGAYYNDGAGWISIGTSSAAFNGGFDGNGKTISGLKQTITGTSSSQTYYGGLFGCMKYASIKNLNVSANIQASGSGTFYIGGIAGYVNGMKTSFGASLYNCKFSGTITCTSNKASSVGGIAGLATSPNLSQTGDQYNCIFDHCSNSGSVSLNLGNVGGITGRSGRITNCYNTGRVIGGHDASTLTTLVGTNAGGIGGYSPTVYNSYNTASITGTYAGGIIGYCGIQRECYNTGDITGKRYAGGLVGYSTDLSVSDSFNAGTVSGEGYSGGISGCGSKLYRCYNIGAVSGATAGAVWGKASYTSGSENLYYIDRIALPFCAEGTPACSGVKCTATQMQAQATYSGFDFDTVWTMVGSANYPYAELKNTAMSVANQTLTTLEVSGPSSCEIPAKNSTTAVSLTAAGSYSNSYVSSTKNLTFSSRWSVLNAPEGVSISQGTLTVLPSAAAGDITVQAYYNGKTDTHVITLIKVDYCANGHSYTSEVSSSLASEANCSNAATYYVQCDNCDAVSDSLTVPVGTARGHSWAEATCTAPRICSVCGQTDGSSLGHNWVAADCDTPKTCNTCGATEGEALDHSWSDWVETKAATYAEPGLETRTCTACGAEETCVIPVLSIDISFSGALQTAGCIVSICSDDILTCNLYLAVYDSNGKMLAIKPVGTCELSAGLEYTLMFSDTASYVKAFIMYPDSLIPMMVAITDAL